MLEYQLLSPEEEAEEIFPFRRVWRALFVEMGALLVVVVGILIATRIGMLEDSYSPQLNVLLALAPVGIFIVVSVRRERRAPQPREGLPAVLILSAIAANGAAWPVIGSVFTPERWLADAGFFSRIIGYTLTLGALAALVKVLVLRYTVWPMRFRARLDGVAYGVPAALGYATVITLHFVRDEEPILSAAAIRVLTNVYLHIAVGAILGYFLAELAIGSNVPVLWLPLGLSISAFLSGVYIAFRRIASVSGLGSRDLGGMALVIGFAALLLGALAFLIESADERTAARRGWRRLR